MTFTPVQREDDALATVYLIVLHTAAVLAAIAMFAPFSSFSAWHWTIAPVFELWAAFVRPAIKAVLDATAAPFFAEVFGWRFDIPPLVQDYLTAGFFVNVVAMARLRRQHFLYGIPRWKTVLDAFSPGAVLTFFALLLFWPIAFLVGFYFNFFAIDMDADQPLRFDLVAMLPAAHAIVLFALNALLSAI